MPRYKGTRLHKIKDNYMLDIRGDRVKILAYGELVGELKVSTTGFDYIITKDGRKIKSPKIHIISITLPEERTARVDLFPELQTLVSNKKITPSLLKDFTKGKKRTVHISTFKPITIKKRH